MIVDKLAKKPGLSYAEIAKTAYNAGQTRLATKVSPDIRLASLLCSI